MFLCRYWWVTNEFKRKEKINTVYVLFCFGVFFWGGGGYLPGSEQELLLALYWGITHGRLQKPYGMPGIRHGLVMCKASTISAILSLWPLNIVLKFIFFSGVGAMYLGLTPGSASRDLSWRDSGNNIGYMQGKRFMHFILSSPKRTFLKDQ